MCKKKLEVIKMPPSQVRSGYVKIHEKTRGPIDSGTLIAIGCREKIVYRIVIGEGAKKKTIVMDEPTRKNLDVKIGSSPEFTWRKAGGIFEDAQFYWRHPDFSINFASRIAIVSLILSTISLALSTIEQIYKWVAAP